MVTNSPCGKKRILRASFDPAWSNEFCVDVWSIEVDGEMYMVDAMVLVDVARGRPVPHHIRPIERMFLDAFFEPN